MPNKPFDDLYPNETASGLGGSMLSNFYPHNSVNILHSTSWSALPKQTFELSNEAVANPIADAKGGPGGGSGGGKPGGGAGLLTTSTALYRSREPISAPTWQDNGLF